MKGNNTTTGRPAQDQASCHPPAPYGTTGEPSQAPDLRLFPLTSVHNIGRHLRPTGGCGSGGSWSWRPLAVVKRLRLAALREVCGSSAGRHPPHANRFAGMNGPARAAAAAAARAAARATAGGTRGGRDPVQYAAVRRSGQLSCAKCSSLAEVACTALRTGPTAPSRRKASGASGPGPRTWRLAPSAASPTSVDFQLDDSTLGVEVDNERGFVSGRVHLILGFCVQPKVPLMLDSGY